MHVHAWVLNVSGVVPLQSHIAELTKWNEARGSEVLNARRDVLRVLKQYHHFVCSRSQHMLPALSDQTKTASEMFLELHHRVEVMEEAVTKAERKRRKELAERF